MMQEWRKGRWAGRECVWAALIVLAGAAFRAAIFAPFAFGHPDELMQYLEQANRLATGQGIIPWEYRYDMRSGLIAQVLAVPFWLGHALAPGTLAGLYAAKASFTALSMVGLAGAWALGGADRRARLAALAMAALWWQMAVFDTLVLSDTLGTALLLAGAGALLAPTPCARRDMLAGLLLGLAVTVRFQLAGFAGVLVLAALGRHGWARARALVAGGLVALAVGALSDLAMGQVPYRWIGVNLSLNLVAGRASTFGTMSPWAYAGFIALNLGPGAVLVVAAALVAVWGPQGARLRPLMLAAVAHTLLHSLIAHKEYRFVWPAVAAVLVLAAIGSLRVADRLAAPSPVARRWALPVLALAWLLLDGWSWVALGGPSALRWGGTYGYAANQALRDPHLCGLAVVNQARAHLVPALMARPVPLYVIPDGVDAISHPLPSGLAGAANALLSPVRLGGMQGWAQAGCWTDQGVSVCLFRRPGRCAAAAPWSYQATLRKEDM